MKMRRRRSVSVQQAAWMALGAAAWLALPALSAGPDCGTVARTVDGLISKADAGPKADAGKTLWEARTALREALKTPTTGTECWRAAARLALKAGDEELASFALVAIKADRAEDPLLAELAGLSDEELVARIPKEREAFVADLQKAEKGDVQAMRRLGDAYSGALGVPSDDGYGVEWYTKAADKADATAMVRLGQRKMAGRGTKEDPEGGFALFKKAADAGSVDGMTALGGCLIKGIGVKADPKAGFEWYLRAAGKGDMDAMEIVGTLYREGIGTAKNDKSALVWLTKAADKGSEAGAGLAGAMILRGEGGPKNLAKAEELLLKASKAKDEEVAIGASIALAGAYLEAKRDVKKAVELLTFAHEHQSPLAAYLLGMCSVRGEGVEKDEAKGVALYREAAEAGLAPAMTALGGAYLSGRGVPKDAEQARSWLTKAAGAGEAEAKKLLSQMK